MQMQGRELPTGTITFLFSDIEGSTRLLQELGGEVYAAELLRHRGVIRGAVAAHGGIEFGTEGDAFFIAFERVTDALAVAEDIQRGLAAGPIRVRIGIHSGTPIVIDGDYAGLDVHKVARICSAGHGGQIVVSEATRGLSDTDLRDLGFHRLKDLTAPERLYQLGSGDFPPLRTLRHTNLPVQPTALLGREEELKELLRLAETVRLITLTGPGGTGKTRLALELAARLAEDYEAGTWWVPLAAVADPIAVESTIANAIGAHAGLAEHIADKQLLILLDNFEQVIDAAPRIGELLALAPRLSFIVTSRERLALAAEQEFPVSPLVDDAAVELFVARARQVKPDFESDAAVVEICRRLDRLPLALELAATRVKLLTSDQLLSRLERSLDLLAGGTRDKPERQATMRAAIGWSYGLLSEPERRCFRALGVFSGSFDLEAAEHVGLAGLHELQSLAEKSLLRQTEDGRFFLLDTTRDFAREQLVVESEISDVAARHARWYSSIARSEPAEAAHRVHRPSLRADIGNIRAALEWMLANDLAEGVKVVQAIWGAWHMRGQHDELVRWFERARARFGELDGGTLAIALEQYAAATFYVDRYEVAGDLIDEGLTVAREIGDRASEARLLRWRGTVLWAKGDFEGAIDVGTRVLALHREAGDNLGIARSLHLLGERLRDAGRLDEAKRMLEQSRETDAALGDVYSAMESLHSLGDLALDAGDASEAARCYLEAFQTTVDLADERSQAYCTAGLACVAASLGDPALAGRLWLATEAVEKRLGTRLLARERERYERALAPIADHEAFRARERLSRDPSTTEAVNEFRAAFGNNPVRTKTS